MTTQSWAFSIDHSSDAGFRLWVADFLAKAAAVGLVQTADTGQINTATCTRPGGTNTTAANLYAVFSFNDTQQSTRPIFIRFDFGTGASASIPAIFVNIGTGSNGSGTITGSFAAGAQQSTVNNTTATGTSRTSYFVAVDGFCGLVWCADHNGALARFGLFISRTVDADGTPNATGAQAVWMTNNITTNTGITNTAQRNFVTGTTFTGTSGPGDSNLSCPIPTSSNQSVSAVGSDVQVFLRWFWMPRVTPNIFMCGAMNSEHANFTTFTATLVGAVARTYLHLGQECGPMTSPANGGAMIWE